MKLPGWMRVIGQSIVDWWDGWLDLVGAMLVWLFAQVTIIFGPPATLGLYYTVHQLINGESLGARGVFEGARIYFGKAWLYTLLNIVVAGIFYANYAFYQQFETFWAAYVQLIFLMLFMVWLMTQLFALPYLMEMQEKRLLIAIRNGFFTSMASPFFSLVIFIFALIFGLFSFVLVLPIFFGVPALIPILGFRAMYNRLETYGLKEREKTPREIEREQSSRIEVPGASEVTDREGQVKKKH